jgi:SAM-dependent methyltransferase
MSETGHAFSEGIPEVYDRHLSVLFEPYALDMVKRLADRPDGPVLETACGTGILTQRLRAGLSPGTSVVATDLSESMLAHARARHGRMGGVKWRQADAGALPFPAAMFAAAACQFGLMFIPDKHAAMREARRVLVDGGVLGISVWDSLEYNPHARVVHDTVAGFFPNDPPQFLKNLPYGYHDPGALRDAMEGGGFAQVKVERVTLEVRCQSAESLATGYVKGTPVGAEIRERGGSLDTVVAAAAEALERLGGDRPFRCPMQAIVATGRARPG